VEDKHLETREDTGQIGERSGVELLARAKKNKKEGE
jgi:hypothetical protein